MDPIECAKNGDIEFFRRASKDVLLHARDRYDFSALDTAIMAYHQDCCEEICRKCPELLYHQDKKVLYTALHHASSRGQTEVIAFLINAAEEFEDYDDSELGGAKKMIRILDIYGNYALLYAVKGNHLDTAKVLIEADPEFEYGAANDGDTPLLSAMAKAKSGDQIAAKIRKLLLEKQPYHCKIRSGEKSWTPLHLSASNGDLDALDEIIRFCPDCTELVDDYGQNFLHIAAQFGHTKLVKYVLDTIDVAPSILNAKDIHGNTPLHIAALSGNEDMTLFLLYDARVFKMTVNTKGQKVLDAVTFDYDKERANVFGVRDKVNEKELKDQSDFDLVVSALIAAVSFTAGITVPGGYISDGPNQGMAMLSKKTAFETFVVSNTFGLLLSLYAVFSHFCTRRLLKRKDIELQVVVAMYCTLGAIFAMVIAFMSGSYAVLNISPRLAATVTGLCCVFFLFTFWASWRMIRQYKQPFSSYLRNKWWSSKGIFFPKKEQPSLTMPGGLPVSSYP
ncbi:hypothetical protein ACHQM5_025148 [Ranunculus cassubicifolius]